MDPARLQIIPYGPQRQIEADLYTLLTREEKVDYSFNEKCWVAPRFLKDLTMQATRFNARVLTIGRPVRHFHPTIGEYASIRVYVLLGPKRTVFKFLIPKTEEVIEPSGSTSLCSYHKANKRSSKKR